MTTAELQLHEPYTDIKAELAVMAEENEKAVFDYRDPKGEKMARSHIYKMRNVKSAIEKKRKELKADALAYGRQVDAVAKELSDQVVAMIGVHQEPLDRIAKEEADRKAAIQQALDAFEISDVQTFGVAGAATVEQWRVEIARIEAIDITPEVFQERMAEAAELKQSVLSAMNSDMARRVELDEERAELARLRAEKEAREQKEREDRIAAEAAEKAKRDAEERAERERVEAERKAQAEQEAAAQREREAQERADRAEREAKEAEARAKADADRRVREAEEAREREAQAQLDAQAKREADRAHVEKVKREAIIGIEDAIGISDDDANRLVDAVMAGLVPHISIVFYPSRLRAAVCAVVRGFPVPSR